MIRIVHKVQKYVFLLVFWRKILYTTKLDVFRNQYNRKFQ